MGQEQPVISIHGVTGVPAAAVTSVEALPVLLCIAPAAGGYSYGNSFKHRPALLARICLLVDMSFSMSLSLQLAQYSGRTHDNLSAVFASCMGLATPHCLSWSECSLCSWWRQAAPRFKCARQNLTSWVFLLLLLQQLKLRPAAASSCCPQLPLFLSCF